VWAHLSYLEDAGERSPALWACIVARRGAGLVDRLARALRAAEGGPPLDGLAADKAVCVVCGHDWLAPLTHTIIVIVYATTVVTEKALALGAVCKDTAASAKKLAAIIAAAKQIFIIDKATVLIKHDQTWKPASTVDTTPAAPLGPFLQATQQHQHPTLPIKTSGFFNVPFPLQRSKVAQTGIDYRHRLYLLDITELSECCRTAMLQWRCDMRDRLVIHYV
jgi:hypothetical protein